MQKQLLTSVLFSSLLMASALQAAEPVSGFSAPAITFQEGVALNDAFNDTDFSDLWSAQLSSVGVGSAISESGGAVSIDGGQLAANTPSEGTFLASNQVFAQQSFNLQAAATIETGTIGDFCAAAFVDTLRIAVCKISDVNGSYEAALLQWDDNGSLITAGQILPSGTLTVGSNLTLNMNFNDVTGDLNGSIPELGFVGALSGVSFQGFGFVSLAATSGLGDGSPVFQNSRGLVSFDFITSNLSGSDGYVASLAPFEELGTAYDQGIVSAPATLFVLNGPIEINSDNTVIPADGLTNYNIALVQSAPGTFPSGNAHTLITDLDEASLLSIPQILSVTALIENAYLAQGYGQDYLLNLCTDIQGIQDQLQIEIDNIDGLGKSLQAKFDKITQAIIEGDTDSALDMINALRNQVNAQAGKKIPSSSALTILALLTQLEEAINCNI